MPTAVDIFDTSVTPAPLRATPPVATRSKYQPKPRVRALTRYQRKTARPRSPSPGSGTRLDQAQTLAIPSNFDLLESPDDTVTFLARIARLGRIRRRFFFDASDVTRVAVPALASLSSLLRADRLQANGNLPRDPTAASTFRSSGALSETSWLEESKGDLFRCVKGTDATGSFAARCIRFAVSKFGLPAESLMPAVYRVLMECMANTANHAFTTAGSRPTSRESIWQLHVFKDEDRNVICFTFVDFGVGIVGSLRRRLLDRVTKMRDQGAILNAALHGEYPSRTRKRNRGLGLAGVRSCAEDGELSRLVVASNRGFVDVSRGVSRTLQDEFPGTLLYWEVPRGSVCDPSLDSETSTVLELEW